MTDDQSLEDLEAEIRAEEAKSQDGAAQEDGIVSADPAADNSDNPEGGEVEDYEKLKAEAETLRKEKAQIEMERNLLRNKQKEAERERLEKVDREDLEKLQSAYEELLGREQEREAEEAEKAELERANSFRDTIISQRPDAVQKAAKALIEKNQSNLAWANARDEADAAAQLNAQLDALESVLGAQQPATPAAEEAEETVTVHPNNPSPRSEAPRKFNSYAEEVKYLEETLPWAPPR